MCQTFFNSAPAQNHPIHTLNSFPAAIFVKVNEELISFADFARFMRCHSFIVPVYRFSRSVPSAIVWWRQETAPPAKVGKMGSIERWRSHHRHTRTGSALFREIRNANRKKSTRLFAPKDHHRRSMLEMEGKVLRFALYEGIFIQFVICSRKKTESNKNIIGKS